MHSRERATPEVVGITHLPGDPLRMILQYLNDVDGFNFYLASPRLFKSVAHPVRKLLGHAALGEWEKATPIYTMLRFLLTCRSTIYHPNRNYYPNRPPTNIPVERNPGRYKYVKCTALQIAWMNEEYEIAQEMATLLDHEEVQKQFAEVFPDGKIVKYNWNLQKAIALLHALFGCVIRDFSITEINLNNMSEQTRQALYALYAYVKPAAEHRIGLVFDTNIFVEALKYSELGSGQFLNWAQRAFWRIRVEEYLASLLGTSYLRQHAQGVFNTLDQKGCHLANKSSYFAFRRTINSLPGFHFYVDFCGAPNPFLLNPDQLRYNEARQLYYKSCVEKKRQQGQRLCVNMQISKEIRP